MLRFGLHKLEQIKKGKFLDLLGKERNISLKLYNDILTDKTIESDEYEKLSEIILNRFNTKSNAIKRTYRNRFNSFDDLSIQTILKTGIKDPCVHDMAISDGRASYYFLNKLNSSSNILKYLGSDIAVSYKLFFLGKERKIYCITDNTGDIIEVTSPPFVWNYARVEGKQYFLNNLFKNHSKNKFIKLLERKQLGEPFVINVIDREFNDLINRKPGFRLSNHNLFDKVHDKYNVVRVMNILHYGYFSEQQIQKILQNIYESLEMGGIFIEGSNEDAGSKVEGSIYLKSKEGFIASAQAELPSRINNAIRSFNTSIKSVG